MWSIAKVFMNKIALWIIVGIDYWTFERAIIASNEVISENMYRCTINTRMYSSRMRTTCLLIMSHSAGRVCLDGCLPRLPGGMSAQRNAWIHIPMDRILYTRLWKHYLLATRITTDVSYDLKRPPLKLTLLQLNPINKAFSAIKVH